MVDLGDGAQVDARFGLFRDSAPNVASKLFWMHLMVLLGDETQVDARLVLFGDSADLDAR
jgi:hypothetical protein